MILVIDNFDSFTYNIVQYIQRMGQDVVIRRNNKISLIEIEHLKPEKIVISPGPGNPDEAGISMDVVRKFKGAIPILGVCLGHQCIGQAFGGKIVQAKSLFHGKVSQVSHDFKGVFKGLPNPVIQTRYHSLVIDQQSLPAELMVTATSQDHEIMGVRHRTFPIEGIQFHPESIASEHGYLLLKNFILSRSPDYMEPKNLLKKIWNKTDLTEAEASFLMEEMAEGKVTPTMTSAILTALSLKGETVDEITGFARIMREKAVKIKKPKGVVVDNCGTGGDNSGTFNISTLASIVLAATGLKVAKHGNRSITSKCGSADLFAQLGVDLDISPEQMEADLKEVGISFLFAQKLHPSMKHVVGVRKELGIRTVFNILGPLSNPAQADIQLIGVFDRALVEPIAQVLQRLGTQRAMVVHGEDGLDEISLTTTTYFAEIKDGWIKTGTLHPSDFGLTACSMNELQGGDIEKNLAIASAILNGQKGPQMDIVSINAAVVLHLAGKVENLKEGYTLAQKTILDGLAKTKIETLVKHGQNA